MEKMARCPNCQGASFILTIAVEEEMTTAQCSKCGAEIFLDMIDRETQRRILERFA